MVSPEGIARMIGELLSSRAMEERIAIELRGGRPDAERVRELESQLSSIARKNVGLFSAIRLQCAREAAEQPEGYMGINFEGIEIRRSGAGPAIYMLGERPVIVSVEPGSPAERAGLAADDEIVMIAGSDARKPILLGQLLKPGARLPVRVMRAGQPREMTVVVARRPDDYGSPCASLDGQAGFRLVPQATFMKRRDPPEPVTARAAPEAVPNAGGFSYGFVTPYAAGGTNLIAGAAFVVLDQDWRETLGVDRGLLVVSVAPGSPAATAGLRKSDVVLSAGDVPLTRTSDLWRVMNGAGASDVTLKVQRGRRDVVIVLKSREER
jgi:serine protease Do